MSRGRKPYGEPLTEAMVLAWADAHYERTGRWPHGKSGPIPEAPGETWNAVNMALYEGHRGLPGRSSLSRLLDRYRRAGWTTRRPWTPEEDEVVRTLPAKEAARRTGRPLSTVYERRRLLRRQDDPRR
jgi:hypothetical protein